MEHLGTPRDSLGARVLLWILKIMVQVSALAIAALIPVMRLARRVRKSSS